ncbi:MAG: GIY-YIG nuclease family protein, partial [Anaerolineae bacterium]
GEVVSMLLFQLLQTLDADLAPKRCKVHLAGWNGQEDPLDEYLAGRFDRWQARQNRKNFERDFVISLIALPRARLWLFAGVHDAAGCDWVAEDRSWRYRLSRRPGPNELDGRLVVSFKRTSRQSYLLGENCSAALEIAELRPEKLSVAEFPGYSWAMLTKQHLDIVVRQQVASWKAALSAVAGVYVIADRQTGKLYVGSATAGEGIWNRWCAYSATGHGGNRELKNLLAAEGTDYAANFQYGILEIADYHASQEDVLRRESYWKELLQTRAHGYNAN